MRSIRLIQMGQVNNTVLSNLTVILTRIQTTYNFIFEDNIIEINDVKPKDDGSYSTRSIATATRNYMNYHNYDEYPITITNLPLEDQLAYSADSSNAILSTNDWNKYSKYPLIKGLEYLIVGVLIDMNEITLIHYDTKCCPNDYCDNRSDIDTGISKAEFCYPCRNNILSAIENGRLTLQEAIAIYRILDDVADRKICFVLMPFNNKFKKVYKAIQKAVGSFGFIVKRADEIFETRSIMQIVFEQIGRSELIIADITDRNPNVFYELGYAHALGKSIILVTQNEADVPFDLRHRQYLLYDPKKLSNSLSNKILEYFPQNL